MPPRPPSLLPASSLELHGFQGVVRQASSVLPSPENTQESHGPGPRGRQPVTRPVADQVSPSPENTQESYRRTLSALAVSNENTQDSVELLEQSLRGIVQEELRHVKQVVSGEISVATDQCVSNIECLRTSLESRHHLLEDVLTKIAGVEAMTQTIFSQGQKISNTVEDLHTIRSDGDLHTIRSEHAGIIKVTDQIPPTSQDPSDLSPGNSEKKMVNKSDEITKEISRQQSTFFYDVAKKKSAPSPSDPSLLTRRQWTKNFLRSAPFEIGMSIAIVSSTISLGLQAEFRLQEKSEGLILFLEVVENICLVVFLMELVLRGYVKGWRAFSSLYLAFDGSLVVLGILYQWILNPISNDNNHDSYLSALVVFRSFRLLRVFRILRQLTFMKSSWQLFSGLLASTSAMFSTLAVLLVLIYAFACLGIECITCSEYLQSREDTALLIDKHFNSLYSTMITLTQFVTLDDVNSVYEPLIKAQPWLILYFLPILTIVSISLMNVVTSVIVETALSLREEESETERHNRKRRIFDERPIMEDLFVRLRKEDDRSISREEFDQRVFETLPHELQNTIRNFHFDSMGHVFDILDHDASGKLTKSEFVTGLLNLRAAELSRVPNEILLVLKHLRVNECKANKMADAISDIQEILGQMRRTPSKQRKDSTI